MITPVIDHLEAALRRSPSRYDRSSLIGAICPPNGGWAASGELSGGWTYRGGAAHVVYLAGTWRTEDAIAIRDAMKADMRRRGVTTWKYEGRPGWRRFWRMKGFEP